ncbi:MAG: HAMP domain-containing sensor histidine kinase [Chitinophagaceae bacterium]
MSFFPQQLFHFQEKIRSVGPITWPRRAKQPLDAIWRARSINLISFTPAWGSRLLAFFLSVKMIGVCAGMDDYEQRKLGIFNQLNFLQLITGICIPVAALFHNPKFPEWAWLIACLPALISMLVLWLNAQQKYEVAMVCYFICYPVVSSIVYMSGINIGGELFFILYGILSVFFLQQISHMLFSVSLSMISYFMLAVVWKDHRFQLETSNLFLYLFNQSVGIVFIFYGLFLIKKENLGYQSRVLSKNREIAANAVVLQQQTVELTELNALKNKLFSVIAHDLKTPMYSLRNLFRNIQQQDTPSRKIKAMLPDMIDNLNYTTGLMENLLQWAKCQMQSEGVKTQQLDIVKMIGDTIKLLQLQAEAKQLTIKNPLHDAVLIMADKDMIDLVLRNLLSNALKFTPANGCITVGINALATGAEVFVSDTGAGISIEAMQKINRSDYFTTNGTAQEPGTGLGLMLCKEFLLKNQSQLVIESEPGKGSRFSFALPLSA